MYTSPSQLSFHFSERSKNWIKILSLCIRLPKQGQSAHVHGQVVSTHTHTHMHSNRHALVECSSSNLCMQLMLVWATKFLLCLTERRIQHAWHNRIAILIQTFRWHKSSISNSKQHKADKIYLIQKNTPNILT